MLIFQHFILEKKLAIILPPNLKIWEVEGRRFLLPQRDLAHMKCRIMEL